MIQYLTETTEFFQFLNLANGSIIGVEKAEYPTEKLAEDYAMKYIEE